MTQFVIVSEETLEDDNLANEFINPDVLTSEQNDQLCAALEALFALPAKEEKRNYPHELSALIRHVFGNERMTFAVNAGDGSLLTAFDPAFCFGIEPEDKLSRKRQGRYENLGGTLPRISKLLGATDTEIEDTIVVLRPDQDGETIIDFMNANWSETSYACFIDHGRKNEEALLGLPGVYVRLMVEDIDVQVYFATDPDDMKNADLEEGEEKTELTTRLCNVGTLDLLGAWVDEQRRIAARGYMRRRRNVHVAQGVRTIWKATHREYGRRFVREARTYDIELVGKTVLNYMPSDWTKMAVQSSSSALGDLTPRLHRREIVMFAQNSGLWRELLILEDEGILLIDPLVIEAVTPIIERAERATTPLRPLKQQEKLGYLSRQSKIKCIRDDPEAGFVAGRWYSVYQRPEEYSKKFTKQEMVKGALQLVDKKRRYYHQSITIGNLNRYYDDDPQHIKYLLSHFDIPDPGDVENRYPELFDAEFDRYTQIEQEYLDPRGFRFKPFQKRDLAAISINTRNVLAHQQGLGKSIEGLAFGLNAQIKEADPSLPVLIVCPQDLIPQWQAEAEEKYGISLKWIGRHKGQNGNGGKVIRVGDEEVKIAGGAIKNLIEAREIAKAIKRGEGGWYITHYEALTSGGARNLQKIEDVYTIRIEKEEKFVKGGWRTDKETGRRRWFDSEWQTVEKEITSAMECPECGHELYGQLTCRHKYFKHANDLKASLCGWNRYQYRIPSIGTILSTAFKKGIIIVDEGTQIASARNSNENSSSQKTKAVVGMRAKYRLLMSGTPVKNFIAQAYWLLWWSVGGKEKDENGGTRWSSRFPYAYRGGKDRFANEYTVIETTYNEETGNWVAPKEVGEVTNHTQLWAQLASVLLRRTKEETGELIPKKKVHVLHSPLGYYQREQMDFWLNSFPSFYAEKHPDDPKVKKGIHVGMAPMLGLDVKLNYASVLPKTDPDWQWTTVPVSNFTPAAYRAMVTIMSLVKQGRRVLVGTDIKAASGWLTATLHEKGVTVRSMLKPHSNDTLDPAERSKVVAEFQEGAMAVLCSTQKAIRLGHNLDKGSAVVLFGLDWDYETYAQFSERVWRLTSELPVDVYVIVTGEEGRTMLGRKWDVIQDKQKGASMALDGYLPEQNEDPPDIAAIVREMVEQGIPATGHEVQESRVLDAWKKVPVIEEYVVPEGFTDDQATPWVIDWAAANAALEQRLQTVADWKAEEEEIADADLADLDIICRTTVIKALCEALDNFFEGATRPIEQVADATSSDGGEISTSSEATASEAGVGDDALPTDESNGPTVTPPTPTAGQLSLIPEEPVAAPATSIDYMGQLKQAKELLDLGVLTQDEFDELKTQLLAGLKAAA